MSATLNAGFDTRRDAEMAVERLVQEHGIERSDIFIAAEGPDNTAGQRPAGSDTEAAAPSPATRDDPALNGRISVSVDIEDEARAAEVRAAFAEFAGKDVSED